MGIDRKEQLHGLMAEFESPEAILAAARQVREAGYREIDAYTPFPVEGLHEVISDRRSPLSRVVLICGLLGAATGFGMQVYLNAVAYPINVGGRPLFSWPAFIPITFELTVLFAAFGAFIGVLVASGFPTYYHPVFNVDSFERASQDRFFLAVKSSDRQFEFDETRQFLRELESKPVAVTRVVE